jgi:excisionase family DNA binding protein
VSPSDATVAFVPSKPQNPAQPNRQLIKLTTVAERLDCSIDSVDRYIRAGKLPIVRLPSGRRRVDQEDLERLIDDWKAQSR